MARRKYSKYTKNPSALADAVVGAFEKFATDPTAVQRAASKYVDGVEHANFSMMEQKLAMWYRALDEAGISSAFATAMAQAKGIYAKELQNLSMANVRTVGGVVAPITA